MDRGYLALYRKIQDHPFYKERREFSKLEAWIDILMEVQHSKKRQTILFKMKPLFCCYGQSLKSVLTWATRWHWSESKVRRFLILLKKMKQIDFKSEKVTTRILVINYHLYDPKNKKNEYNSVNECFKSEGQSDGQMTRPNTCNNCKTKQLRRTNEVELTNKRRTSDEQVTTDKHVKKVKNEKNIILGEFKIPSFIPENYSIQENHIKYALSKKLNKDQTEDQFEAFCIHHRAKGTKFKSWYAAFQNWIRNSIKFGKVDIENNNSNIPTQSEIDEQNRKFLE